jgi:hypothetical protein
VWIWMPISTMAVCLIGSIDIICQSFDMFDQAYSVVQFHLECEITQAPSSYTVWTANPIRASPHPRRSLLLVRPIYFFLFKKGGLDTSSSL